MVDDVIHVTSVVAEVVVDPAFGCIDHRFPHSHMPVG